MRIINEESLPSKGLFGNRQIEISPVVYGKLSSTVNEPSNTVAERLLKDLHTYIMDIPGWESLCSFDYAALVFLKKHYTISTGAGLTNVTVTCPHCKTINHYRLNLIDTLEFPDLKDDLKDMRYVELGGKRLKKYIPNMQEFEEILRKFVSFGETLDEPEIMMRAFLGFSTDPNGVSGAIYRASQSDAALVQYLASLCSLRAIYKQGLTCNKCKEVFTVARSDYFVTDPFRSILQNFKIPKEKIVLYERVQS